MSLIKKVLKYYGKIPIEVLNIAAPFYNLLPDSFRMGRVYKREMKELERINKCSLEEIKREQNEKLKRIVSYSYIHVPYYKKLFDDNGINPNDILSVDDLYKIPFLTKELLIKHRDELISDEFRKEDLIEVSTSGSTGAPTRFYVESDSHMRDWVYVYQMFDYLGYNSRSSKLILRGKVFHNQKKGKIWQWDAFKRELSINIFSLNEKNMETYCCAIEKYKPDFAYGYISAMYCLCKYISKRGGLSHKFKGFIGISETIYPEQKSFVEKVLQAPVVSFYGMSERVIIAGMCPYSSEYHIEPLYGIAELVDNNGKIIIEPGVKGELVGTGLLNYAMPLLRYKTGDISTYSLHAICQCGSYKQRLTNIEGRWKYDQLVGESGALISMTALNIHSEAFNRVVRYQILQDTVGKAKIKIVPDVNFSDKDAKAIISVFSEKTKGEIVFSLKLCKDLPPKANGKFSLIDQRLDLAKYL